MRNSKYWVERFEELETAMNRYGMESYRKIEPAFDRALREIDQSIEKWLNRIAVNNQVSLADARKLLNADQLDEFKWTVEEYIKHGEENALNQQWMKQLENASAKYHISKLEAMRIETQNALEKAFGNYVDEVDDMAKKVLENGYYRSIYEVQRGIGVGWDVASLNESKLKRLISKPWATDGENFSSRIWKNKTEMVSKLHNELTRNCILGKAPDEAIRDMTQYVNKFIKNAKSAAGRLVMTEEAYFSAEAQRESFKELGVEEYEIIATLDSKTSEICQDMDGRIFPMSQYEPGATAPPFHPWCRTTTAPYFDDLGEFERAARDENGKTYYVPGDMTYKEWLNNVKNPTGNTANSFTDEEASGIIDTPHTADIVEKAVGARQGTPISIEDAITGANPNYSLGGRYTINCQRCVQTYELRRRGYDVIAKPKPESNNTVVWGSECFIPADETALEAFKMNLTASAVKQELASAPDGARYTIYVKWKGRNRSAHVFIAEKNEGVIQYLDPQKGNLDASRYFNLGRPGKFGFFRMDDKSLTTDEDIIKSTVEVK